MPEAVRRAKAEVVKIRVFLFLIEHLCLKRAEFVQLSSIMVKRLIREMGRWVFYLGSFAVCFNGFVNQIRIVPTVVFVEKPNDIIRLKATVFNRLPHKMVRSFYNGGNGLRIFGNF